MVNSGRGRSGGSFLRSTWFLRVVELVLVPALLVYSLWLPPASLGSRLFSDGYPVISAREGGTVLGPNGSSLNVPAGAVASRTKVRLDALSCNAEAGVTVARPELFVNTAGIQALQIKPGDPETVAILQLPEDLIVYAPFYRLDVKGQAPSHAEVTLPVPYELGVVARADLYGWNGSEWSWLPSDETPDGMYIRAQLEPLPKLLVVAQPYASSVLIGVDVSPVSYQAPAAADLVYVPGLYLAGGPELVGEVPN
ncbi:MAG: hypothetical protein FJZ90_19875, partial [Chloroflexi bacterium]|nr:hypothetical protein [Chloroflexota bacterium]